LVVRKNQNKQASGDTARPENRQTTGPTGSNSEEAGRGKDPARREEGETPGTWNPNQGCLVVEIKQGLEPGLSKFMIELTKGEVHVVGTDKVQQPELIVTERIYADSEPEARGFYEKNGSGVDVKANPKSLYVRGESSPGAVSGGSESDQIRGVSGRVVVVNSNISGDIVNIVSGSTIGPSQSPLRMETPVVLKVPVANEGGKSEPEYIIEVGSGNVIVENGAGEYDISVNAGSVAMTNVIFTGDKNTVTTGAGDIFIKFGEGQSEIEVQTSLGGGTFRRTKTFFKGVQNPNGQTARLILTTKAGEIEVK
jgi:hypothetical protein